MKKKSDQLPEGVKIRIIERISQVMGDINPSNFAKIVGVSQGTMSNYMTIKHDPSLKAIYNMCHRCHVSADWVLGFTDERQGTCAPRPDPESAKRIAALEAEIAALKTEKSLLEAKNAAFLESLKAIGKGK